MKYIICQDWKSTSGNHAGMVHLYQEIHNHDPQNTRLYVIKQLRPKFIILWEYLIAFILIFKLRKGDKVLLTECLIADIDETQIARFIRRFRSGISFYGMVHLIPSIIEEKMSTESINKKIMPLDGVITLGSSLTSYLCKFGVPSSKIHTLFHYADVDYYKPSIINKDKKSVVVMGALGRDYTSLAKIVKSVPELHFNICKGRKNVDYLFEKCNNVTLFGYLSEDELKEVMDSSSISLNVMDDTIGSNVICTSMAMGLSMVVSDVGSIRDYCTDSNALFCKNVADFIKALHILAKDDKKNKSMGVASLLKARDLSILHYKDALYSVLDN